MTSTSPIVLANAGPLMALGKLNRLHLLADLYAEVRIPQAVYDEVVVRGLAQGFDDALTVQLFWKQHAWPGRSPLDLISGSAPSCAKGYWTQCEKNLGNRSHHRGRDGETPWGTPVAIEAEG